MIHRGCAAECRRWYYVNSSHKFIHKEHKSKPLQWKKLNNVSVLFDHIWHMWKQQKKNLHNFSMFSKFQYEATVNVFLVNIVSAIERLLWQDRNMLNSVSTCLSSHHSFFFCLQWCFSAFWTLALLGTVWRVIPLLGCFLFCFA